MKIKDIVSLPSQALQAMVDGLRKQSKREDFVVNMDTFGNSFGSICIGCAATCCVMEITNVQFDANTIQFHSKAKATGIDIDDLADFENAIDSARKGRLHPLFYYFDCPHEFSYDVLWHLSTSDWEEQLPKVEEFIELLKSKNL